MRDDYGRDIRYLRLSVTDRCNCRCVYCMPENGVPMLSHADILSFEEMRDIVAAAASLGVRKVRLTGGEPLVRRGIVDLVGMVALCAGHRRGGHDYQRHAARAHCWQPACRGAHAP